LLDKFQGCILHEKFKEPLMNTTTSINEISVHDLKAKMDSGETCLLLDVRESFERDICHLGGAFIPLGELAARYTELDLQQPIIVYCRSGGRSLKAAEFLQSKGYQVTNLAGGVTAWAANIDPDMPTY
jgi:rhodanese-related sulfurtransferase